MLNAGCCVLNAGCCMHLGMEDVSVNDGDSSLEEEKKLSINHLRGS
jgi:hypothetical protein